MADKLVAAFPRDPAGAAEMLTHLTAADFDLPLNAWANRVSGKSQGQHTEDTAKRFAITRAEQDRWALRSHQRAVAGQDAGFFDDLIIPFGGVEKDTLPRRDTSLESWPRCGRVYDPPPARSPPATPRRSPTARPRSGSATPRGWRGSARRRP